MSNADEDMDRAVQLALVRHLVKAGAARQLREESHLSLADVGRALHGVAPSTVLRWEHGHCVPRGERALRYAELLTSLARTLGEAKVVS